LDLSKNRLTELPESFGDLIKLNRLDLYGNQLKTLPLSFGQLVKLKWLDLKDNPLDTTLAKYSGDCANQKQCELCAVNVVKFMKSEKLRIDSENRDKERKLLQQQEVEKQLQEKSRKEKEKKKAKVQRRNARKAQQLINENEDTDEYNVDTDSDKKPVINKSGISFGYLVSIFLRILFTVLFVSVIIFVGVAIGLHLQNGAKLESVSDIKIALINAFSKLKDYKQFTNDVGLLIKTLINSLQNWRHIFKIYDNKQNETKIDN
jgi:Leucine-rich repeat (LRR) protein